MNELNKIFGNKIGNALLRNGVNNIEELRQYSTKIPYYQNIRACYWRGIGDKGYKIIENYLREEG